MHRFLFTSALLLPLGAAAEDLFQVYRDAQRYDAAYSAARLALEAGREKLPQGRALILPTLNLTGSATRSRFDIDSNDPAISASFVRSTNAASYTLTLTQPLYRPQNWYQYEQGEFQVRQAEATFSLAYQDLVIRVSQAYFDGLAAVDTLNLVRAQKAAISEQLAQAKRNFEVGTATITDTHEAQARYDLSSAQEIAAINDLESKQRVLQQLTGKVYTELKRMRGRRQARAAESGQHGLVGGSGGEAELLGDAIRGFRRGGAARSAARERGAHADPRHRRQRRPEHRHRHHHHHRRPRRHHRADRPAARRADLPGRQPQLQGARGRGAVAQGARRPGEREAHAALTARQNYLAVINGIAQVGALEQALVSSQSALDSNRLGYEVGVRINIDVLNAQQQLFSTRRDLAVARYNTITNQLRLKAAAGSLREEDLEEINRALER
jgi:outer membrane protein